MYTLRMNRRFVAQHYLTVPDCGDENELHSHTYGVEVTLHGDSLDAHGYLVDIVDLTDRLEALVRDYRDRTLNDLPEFAGLNPSIEHFSRIFCLKLSRHITATNLSHLTVRLFEDEIASASFTSPLPASAGIQ